MANESVRYNVVVTVDVQNKGNAGATQAKQGLAEWEKQAIESSRRIERESEALARVQQQASQQTAQIFKSSNDLMARYANERIASEEAKAKEWTNQFKIEERKKQEAFEKTVKYIESQDPYSKFFFKSKQEGLAFGKVLDELFGKTKKLSTEDILGKNDESVKRKNQEVKALIATMNQYRAERQQLLNESSTQIANQLSARGNFNASGVNALGFNNPSQSSQLNNFTASSGYIRPSAYDTAQRTGLREFNNQIKALDPFQTAQLTKTSDVLKQIDASSRQASGGMNVFASAFKGAFVGALTGTIFRLLLEIPQAFINAGVEAIKAASSFERTTNAFTALAGSASAAKEELSAIADLARNTVGLGLESAEKGALNLRAVGFEAKQARDIIEGVSKIRVLSGASQDSIDRFVYNLTQVRSAGKLTGRELRDALREIPAIAPVLQKAFGTTSSEKIAELGLTSDEFFKRLIKQFKELQDVEGGTEDAYQKFANAWTEGQRTFGQPTLEPITQLFKDLTAYLKESSTELQSWGETFGGIVRLVDYSVKEKANSSDSYKYLGKYKSVREASDDPNLTLLQSYGLVFESPVEAGLIGLGKLGNQLNPKATQFSGGKLGQPLIKPSNIFDYTNVDNQTIFSTKKNAFSEDYANNSLKTLDNNLNLADKAKKDNEEIGKFSEKIKELKTIRETDLSNLESYYIQRNAKIDKGLRNTSKDELAYELSKTALSKQEGLKRVAILETELSNTKKAQEAHIATFLPDLQEGVRKNSTYAVDNAKAQADIDKERSKLLTQDVDNYNKILRLNQQIREEKRQANIESVNILESRVTQGYDTFTFNTERQIALLPEKANQAYDRLINVTKEKTAFLAQVEDVQYKLSLQNEKLSDDQRENLKESHLNKEIEIAEKGRREVLKIEEDKYNQQTQFLEKANQRQQEILSARASSISGLGAFFNPQGFGGQNLKSFQQAYYTGDNPNLLESLQERLGLANKDLASASGSPENMVRRVANLNLEIENTQRLINKGLATRNPYAEEILTIYNNAELASKGLSKFDEIAKRVLGNKQTNEQTQLIVQQSFNNAKLDNAIRFQRSRLRGNVDSATGLAKGDRQAELESFNATTKGLIDGTKTLSELTASGKIKDVSTEILDAKQAVDLTDLSIKTLTSTQAEERLKLFQSSFKGLTERLNELKEGSKDTVEALNEGFRNGLLSKQIGQYEQIYQLKYDIAHSPYVDAQEVEIANLQDIIALNHRHTEEIIRADKAKRQISEQLIYNKNEADTRLLEFFAQQKGATDIISDARIGLLTSAYSELDKVAQSLAKHFGFASDAVESLISSLLKLAVNAIFQKYFGGSLGIGGSGSQGSVSPSFGSSQGNQQSGGITGLIEKALGLGGSGGGGGASGNGGGLFSGNQGDLIYSLGSSANQSGHIGFPLGGANITTNQSALLKSLGLPDTGLLGVGTASTGSKSSILGGFAGLASSLPFIGAGLGASLGGKLDGNTLSKILGIAGGAGVGIGGGLIGSGLLLGGLGGLGLAATGVLTAGLSVIPLVAAYFISRSAKRKKDEVIHNDAMLKALGDLDSLIDGVNNNTIDGASALTQADKIKADYLSTVNAIKDKKTKTIATSASEVGRLDTKIQAIKDAISNQKARQARQDLLVPTFADGGSISSFGRNNFKNNPLGYQNGLGTGKSDSMLGFFPQANQYARYSASEYVLDAETTANIGVSNLDQLRATKGKDLSFIKPILNNGFRDGGAIIPQGNFSSSSINQVDSKAINLNLSLNIGLSENDFIEVINSAIQENNGSESQIGSITTKLNNEGDSAMARAIFNQIKPMLNK